MICLILVSIITQCQTEMLPIATYEAEQIKPDYHNAWHKNFGNALYQMANYQEAVTSYDQALRFKPDDHEVWNNRGIALRQLVKIT